MNRAERRRWERAQGKGQLSVPVRRLFNDWWGEAGRSWAASREEARSYPEIPGVPPAWLVAELSDIVDRAVSAELGTTAKQRAVVAGITNGVTFMLTGRRYIVQAGRLAVPVQYQNGDSGLFVMDPALSQYADAEYHAWVARPASGQRVEIIDLSARHYSAWAAQQQATVVLPDGVENLSGLWDIVSDAAELLPGLQLVADSRATTELVGAVQERPALVSILIDRTHAEVADLRDRWQKEHNPVP